MAEGQRVPKKATARGEESGVKSARRAVEVIELLAAHGDWLTLGQVQSRLGVPRSSLHGLLRTLAEAGWVEEDARGRGFRLGVHALTSGTAYLDHDPAVPYATAALEQIRSECGFTAHLARRFGDQVVYLETRESRNSTMLVSRVGRTLPVYATALGKALLAELVDEEIEQLLPQQLQSLTEFTVSDRATLLESCAVIRRQGYASENQEGTLGVRCVAAVIPYRIPASDAISCSMPIDRVTDAQAKDVAQLVVRVTEELGRTLRINGIR
ncbi:IclR family transcriptional regulator [Rudaeicoccus suwonensis]|uniref:Glycerol operon regulatory protein n=1 Tax=Rudaeicoccus suwonensis TaxID=657409 RepID=A0A561EC73_9MICO|nr:IclR family transcriptional regulator [Rudaeicoccus suwonensis]TWE13212.1 IclR family transcriptional regulator [Rudaeicoccus suwonensis]